MESDPALRARYQRVMQRVAEAAERSGREASEITVVAVTKYAEPTQVQGLLALGHRDLGENRVQQLQQRLGLAEGHDVPVRWHMVGHLQRNKARTVLPHVHLIHSVDSPRLADTLEREADKQGRTADVLVQANIAGEDAKFGAPPTAVPDLARHIQGLPHVRLRGLMSMPPYSEDPEASRPLFQQAARLFEEMKQILGDPLDVLSIGMTEDFEIAIECGGNMVRVGRALFREGA